MKIDLPKRGFCPDGIFYILFDQEAWLESVTIVVQSKPYTVTNLEKKGTDYFTFVLKNNGEAFQFGLDSYIDIRGKMENIPKVYYLFCNN